MEKYFLDIPVYRIPKDIYYREMGKYIERKMYAGPALHVAQIKEFYTKNPGQKQFIEKQLFLSYGGAWDYNEIIGYIRLYFFGTQIRGEYWGINAKRITRTRKKLFEFKTWKLATEIDLSWETDSLSIYSKILEYIEDCAKKLKGRFIDISNLKEIGQHVDWKSLYEKERNI